MGQEKKGDRKGEGLDSESYFTAEYSANGSGRNIIPFLRLQKRPASCQNMSQKDWAILGGRLAKFVVTITPLKFPLFWNLFQTGICKLRRFLRLIAGCWECWYNTWASQRTLPLNIFPIQRYVLNSCGQVVILNLVILKNVHFLGF